MKKQKIEDIKNVHEFYNALVEESVNKLYEECFKSEEQFTKSEALLLARCAVRRAYHPIRRKYTKQERKKYDKIIDDYERYLGAYQKRVELLGKIVDLQEQKIKSFLEFLTWGKESFQQYTDKAIIDCINQEIKYIKQFIEEAHNAKKTDDDRLILTKEEYEAITKDAYGDGALMVLEEIYKTANQLNGVVLKVVEKFLDAVEVKIDWGCENRDTGKEEKYVK